MSDWIPAIITGGVGAAVGGVGAAMIQSMSGRGVSRAEAADKVTNAAGHLADRLDKMNTALELDNQQMRKAIIALTDVMEEMVVLIPDAVIRERARNAVTAARLAVR